MNIQVFLPASFNTRYRYEIIFMNQLAYLTSCIPLKKKRHLNCIKHPGIL